MKTLDVQFLYDNGFPVLKLPNVKLAGASGKTFMMVYFHVPDNLLDIMLRYLAA
jgi:hypothetical protein